MQSLKNAMDAYLNETTINPVETFFDSRSRQHSVDEAAMQTAGRRHIDRGHISRQIDGGVDEEVLAAMGTPGAKRNNPVERSFLHDSPRSVDAGFLEGDFNPLRSNPMPTSRPSTSHTPSQDVIKHNEFTLPRRANIGEKRMDVLSPISDRSHVVSDLQPSPSLQPSPLAPSPRLDGDVSDGPEEDEEPQDFVFGQSQRRSPQDSQQPRLARPVVF